MHWKPNPYNTIGLTEIRRKSTFTILYKKKASVKEDKFKRQTRGIW